MIKYKKWISKIFRSKSSSLSRYGKICLDKNERVEKVSDVINEGDIVKVKVLDVDGRGKVKLSMKEVEAEQ